MVGDDKLLAYVHVAKSSVLCDCYTIMCVCVCVHVCGQLEAERYVVL